MTMKEWFEELDSFLKMTDNEILENKGVVSHKEALEKALKKYLEETTILIENDLPDNYIRR